MFIHKPYRPLLDGTPSTYRRLLYLTCRRLGAEEHRRFMNKVNKNRVRVNAEQQQQLNHAMSKP